MTRRSFRRDCRGQVLIVSGLLVAMILLSTALYVIEVSKDQPVVEADVGFSFEGYKSSLRNTLVSALANASSSGDSAVLAADLAQLKSIVVAHSYEALLTMDYILTNGGGYQNGVYIWSGNGSGVSSALVNCIFHAQGNAGISEASYIFNVTSQLTLSGRYVQENDTVKQVTLNLAVFNEGAPALAQSFVFQVQNATEWTTVESPAIIDHGDGSYTAAFTVQDTTPNDPLAISALCVDTRGITIGANATCSHI